MILQPSTLGFLSAVLLVCGSHTFAQQVTKYDCPSSAKTSADQEKALKQSTIEYLTALKANDWASISKFGTATLASNRNLDFGEFEITKPLMRDLLEPLDLKEVAFHIQRVSSKPCEASVFYTLTLKAIEPQTQKIVVDLSDLKKVIRWRRFECACPPENITAWKMVQDVADVDLQKAVVAAKSATEQKLLLLGKSEQELSAMALNLRDRGVEILNHEGSSAAFEAFRTAQILLDQISYREQSKQLADLFDLQTEFAKTTEKGDLRRQVHVALLIARIYRRLDRHNAALTYLDSVLKRVNVVTDPAAAAKLYASIGAIHLNQQKYADAISYLSKSLELFRKVPFEAGEDPAKRLPEEEEYDQALNETLIGVLCQLEVLYELQGQGDIAHHLHQQVLAVFDQDTQAGFHYALGQFHLKFGSTVKAADYMRAFMNRSFSDQSVSSGDVAPEAAAHFLYQLGKVESEAGKKNEAIADLESSFAAAQRIRTEEIDDAELLKAKMLLDASADLIELFAQHGDFAKAAKYLVAAQDVLKDDDENEQRLNFITPTLESMFYQAQGDEPLAKFHTQQAAEIIPKDLIIETVKESTKPTSIPFQVMLSVTDPWQQGNLQIAYDRYSLAVKLAEAGNSEEFAAIICMVAGVGFESKKSYDRALEFDMAGLRHLEKIKPFTSIPLSMIQEFTGAIQFSIGRVQAAQGNYDEALMTLHRVLDRKNTSFYYQEGANVATVLGATYFGQQKYKEALSAVDEGLNIVKFTGNREAVPALYAISGMSQRRLKQYDLAGDSFNKSIAAIEASRAGILSGSQSKERFFTGKLGPYHEMISMLVDSNKCEEALAYAERSKSQVLLEVLGQGKIDVSEDLSDEERERQQELRSNLVAAERAFDSVQADKNAELLESLKKKRSQARLELEAFRANMLLRYSKRDAGRDIQVGGIDPTGTKDVVLRENEAVLEFAVTDDETYLFVLTGGEKNARSPNPGSLMPRCAVHKIPISASDLKGQIKTLDQRIGDRNGNGIVRPSTRKLYDLLLKPAQADLLGKTTLVIVPDQDLWFLPFQALQSSDDRYLLQDSAIYYAPSLNSLARIRKSLASKRMRSGPIKGDISSSGSRRHPTILILASPQNPGLSSLQETAAQAPKLAKLYGAGSSKMYLRDKAPESRFKTEAPKFDVIHIGAHGIFDSDDPLHSRIVLSPPQRREPISSVDSVDEPREDGMLEAWEIMDLRLQASLMVLSACDTAQGEVGGSEGIVGLTWASLMAGVPTMVVSQWNADENATARLMYFFHQNLLNGPSTAAQSRKAEALRQASLKLLDSPTYSHPHYWAAFIVVGDGN